MQVGTPSIAGKAELLKRAIGTDTLTTKISGEKISFPWFPYTQNSDEIRTYTELITKLCEMANRQKRTGAVKETDNEKYIRMQKDMNIPVYFEKKNTLTAKNAGLAKKSL